MHRLWHLVPLGIVLLAGACTTGWPASAPPPTATTPQPSATTPQPAATAPPGTAISAAARLPLDQYLLRPAQANDLDTVIKRLTRDCMLRHGRTWTPGERNDFDLLRHRSHRFGLADEELAAASGYHWDPVPARPPVSRAQTAGCADEASRAVGWPAGEFDWLRRLGDETLRLTYADARATALVRRWSDCMAEAGHRYTRPRDAETDARWGQQPRASAAEKRTAVADVRCKARVRLTDELSGVLAEKQERAARENAGRLDAFRRMVDSAGARADALRGDHWTPDGPSTTAAPPGQWRTEHASA